MATSNKSVKPGSGKGLVTTPFKKPITGRKIGR